jgi:uncharacterized membrane protein
MWSRGILKSNAKIALKGRYWTAFGVCVVAMLIGNVYSMVTSPINSLTMAAANSGDYSSLMALSGVSSLISLGSILFSVFVVLPLSIGIARFFVQNHFGVSQFEALFSPFRRNYINGVGGMFVTYLFVSLWSLLLVIPGIVKALQYSMVPFILSDNPDMPGSRAREISRLMTDGQKGSIFVLCLSFIGWILLGVLCLGVGVLFVLPYFEATMAELYIFLRDRVIQTNQVNPAEFGLVIPEPAPAE